MDKCKKCFKTAIKACDGFGTFITFRINDDIEYKSLIGGCSTILFVIITVVYASYCCSSFFARKNVDFIFTNKIVQADPIKTFGAFTVKAKLGYEVSGTINLLVVEG